jgi:sterol desaturase/sphingolipid hydroxylase (fatty acid hydroxylase superfamily)
MTLSPGRAVRKGFTLRDAGREFAKHPSPWVIGTALATALTARIVVGDWQISDAVVPVAMLALFPFFEWVIHVFVLHWRPKRVGRLTIDPLLARDHRRHHIDPRNVSLVFIPWKALLWATPLAVVVALFGFPRVGLGLTGLVFLMALGIGYEWTHYLVHSEYRPKSGFYRAIWRNHRQHHFKNEHYWFTVTSSGTADRVLGTYPEAAAVETSPTAKNLHALEGQPTS